MEEANPTTERSEFVTGKSDTKILDLEYEVEVDHVISSVKADEDSQTIYTGCGDREKPIKVYNYRGLYQRHLKAERSLFAPNLAVDTRRRLLLAAGDDFIITFDGEGNQAGVIVSPQFRRLHDIVYQPYKDLYVVGDAKAHSLFYVDPITNKVVRSVEAEEARDAEDGRRNLYMTALKTNNNPSLATLDMDKGLVKLYNCDGTLVRSYGGKGAEEGQLDRAKGICVDAQGRLLVSDTFNHRVVRLSPDVGDKGQQWKVLSSTHHFCLGHPRRIDYMESGRAAMAFYTKRGGPFYLATLTGLY